MSEIKFLLNLLLALVPASAAVRAVILLIRISHDDDQAARWKQDLKNLLIFVAVAEAGLGVLEVVYSAILTAMLGG